MNETGATAAGNIPAAVAFWERGKKGGADPTADGPAPFLLDRDRDRIQENRETIF
jgi:hypothetical protein